MLAHRRIPRVRGRIRELRTSIIDIRGPPRRGKSEGVIWDRNLIKSTLIQRTTVLNHTLNLNRITNTGQQVRGTQEFVSPSLL